MERKIYVLTYASFIDEDSEVYTECVGVFGDRGKAAERLAQDYRTTLAEDFGGMDGLRHYCDDTSFQVSSSYGDIKTVTERITETTVTE